MNKPAKIAIGAAVLVLAYSASCWFVGSRVESVLDAQYEQAKINPIFSGQGSVARIIKREYARGIFQSTDTATIELNPGAPQGEQLNLVVTSTIIHGPFPGLSTVAAATVNSDLTFADSSSTELTNRLKTIFSGKNPLKIHSEIHLNGSTKTTVDVLPFDADLGEEDDVARLSCKGGRIDFDFDKDISSYAVAAQSGGCDFRSDDLAMSVTGVAMNGGAHRMFQDDPLLYVGTQRLTVDKASVESIDPDFGESKKTWALERIVYNVDMPVKGDLIDFVFRTSAEIADVGGTNYGPAHYDFSLKNLHGRTLSKLYSAMMALPNESGNGLHGNSPEFYAALADLRKQALELLNYNPEFRIDRVDFNSPAGRAALSGYAKVNDFQKEDAENPNRLLNKLEAGLDGKIPEALMLQLSVPGDSFTEEERKIMTGRFSAQVNKWVTHELVIRDAEMLKSQALYKDGELTVNGKPFNPMAMQSGDRVQDEDEDDGASSGDEEDSEDDDDSTQEEGSDEQT